MSRVMEDYMKNTKNPFPLRPHHGMCLQYFTGHGYSEGFTAHMAQVKAMLESSDPKVRLICQPDEICSQCPNLQNGSCSTEEKVCRYDRSVLELTGIQEDTEISWNYFQTLVSERILKNGKRKSVCGDCQWDSLCMIIN